MSVFSLDLIRGLWSFSLAHCDAACSPSFPPFLLFLALHPSTSLVAELISGQDYCQIPYKDFPVLFVPAFCPAALGSLQSQCRQVSASLCGCPWGMKLEEL